MTEALRRITIEAELPEVLFRELQGPNGAEVRARLDDRIGAAVTEWAEEQWRRAYPVEWAAHVTEIRRRVDELDAHPERAIPIEQVEAELLAEFGPPDDD